MMTKEAMVEVKKNNVRLPDDFYVLNYAYLTSTYKVSYRANAGRETENRIVGFDGDGCCPKCYKPEVDCC